MNIKSFLLVFFLTVSPAAFAQVQIPNEPFFYRPAESYTMATLDNYTVSDAAHNRQIPIFIRYPANATGQLPLILWSHGGGANPNGKYNNVEWGTTLAQAGYIVIHQSHLTRTNTEAVALYAEFGLTPQQGPDFFIPLEVDRPRDAAAVLNDLNNIEAAFPQLQGRIDRSRIGVGGHSFGAYTVMTLAGGRVELTPQFNDVSFSHPLPVAFLSLSQQGPGRWGWKNDSWREISRPVLTATGSNDNSPNEQAADRAIPFWLMPSGRKYQFFIAHPDSTHDTFNLNNDAHPEFSQWLASSGLAFLDAYLKNRSAAQAYLLSFKMNRAARKIGTIRRR